MRVLVVEGDSDRASALVNLFTASGLDGDFVLDGAEALARINNIETDLLVLDMDLSDMDGLELCGILRERGYEGGVVIMSSRSGELDVVGGLDAGADDYLVTPCSIAELQSRVRSVLRRIHRTYLPTSDNSLPGPRLEVIDHHITFDGIEILTHGREYDVLALLIQSRGRVVHRDILMNEVWGPDWHGSPMVLPSAVGRIRARLEAAGASEQVENVRGIGFRLHPT